MGTFISILWIVLAVAGGVLLALVILVAAIIFWFRRKMSGLAEKLSTMAAAFPTVPPMRIELERQEHNVDEWIDPEEVEKQVQAFEELGFRRIGVFEIDEIDTTMVALHHSAQHAAGIVYEQPALGVWVDFATTYDDGRHFTASTSQHDLLEKPPGRSMINAPELDVPELYERFLQERPTDSMTPVPVEGFAEFFEREWVEEMTWRGARGGPGEEEIRAIAARDGTEATPESIETIQECWRSAYADYLSDELREQYLRGGTISAAEWERIRDRLLFVHEWSTARDLAMQILNADEDMDDESDDSGDDEEDWEDQLDRLANEFKADSRRESFRHLNAQLPEGRRLEPIGEMREPVPADVYLTRDEW